MGGGGGEIPGERGLGELCGARRTIVDYLAGLTASEPIHSRELQPSLDPVGWDGPGCPERDFLEAVRAARLQSPCVRLVLSDHGRPAAPATLPTMTSSLCSPTVRSIINRVSRSGAGAQNV